MIQIHEKLQQYERQSPTPILHNAATLADDLTEDLHNTPENGEIRELAKLLSQPHLKALLSVHDTVAMKNYDPVLPPMPDDLDDDEDSVKIIRLVKNKEPLGATIRRDESTGAIVVARIMHGGAADRSGLIHIGDELKEVNGIVVDDKRPEEIIQILAQSQGAITFKIIPGIKEETPTKESKMLVRTLFDYDPKEDQAIPCKEAGLSFKKGDILQIVSQDDATWWQAKRECDANLRAGLIPSKQFQERRFALRKPVAFVPPQRNSNRRSSGLRRSFRLSRKDRKTNKSMYESKRSELYDTADVPTYEEVVSYQHQPNEKYRLVVLVGPSGVGLNELKRKLLISDSQHYGVTVPQNEFRVKPGMLAMSLTAAGVVDAQRLQAQVLLREDPAQHELAPEEQEPAGEDGERVGHQTKGSCKGEPHQATFIPPAPVLRGSTGPCLSPKTLANQGGSATSVPDAGTPGSTGIWRRTSAPNQDTTRPKRSQETDGVEYHFISKHLFETDVQNNKFIEHGEYRGNLYGTSIDSIRHVLDKNKVCLLDVQCHTIKHLRTLEFKPYVIFIKPPSLERLRETRKNAKIISSKDDKGSAKPFTEEDLQEMIKSGELIEAQWSHLFDKILVNGDLSVAYKELKSTLDNLEKDPFWIPVNWLHS
ncbi:MAGUK p55 subfamily member 7 isoform X2 [Scyliorhinus torazame]|uniref:MAGUK p55 subfamily member 7 isoform X2 n=1 Tax=Scyliorhinus torazame TaxID=75743 RepID=UPI003B5C6855